MKKDFEVLVEVPNGASVAVEKNSLTISFNGKSAKRVFNPREMIVESKDGMIVVRAKKHKKTSIALINAFVGHLKNILEGLQNGYEYKLEIVYSHFPMTITQKGNVLEIANVGGSKKQRIAKILGDTMVQVKGKEVTVKGSNKEYVGQTAANIENASKIKGKDNRVFQDGVYITKKPQKRSA